MSTWLWTAKGIEISKVLKLVKLEKLWNRKIKKVNSTKKVEIKV
jgi:hypothetical protein